MPFLEAMVSHQIRILGNQVQEILIVADIQAGKGRFHFQDEAIVNFKKVLEKIQRQWKVRIEFVDYSPNAQTRVAGNLWNKNKLPVKDYRGGPFYSYFYGIEACACDYVLHLDSDMILGGGLQSWCSDAINVYEQDDRIASILPLSGPPPRRPGIPDQFRENSLDYKKLPHSYRSNKFTTRVFLIAKERFIRILRDISLDKPDMFRYMLGKWQGNPSVQAPEQLLGKYCQDNKYYRLDYLGNGPGLWTLHPPFRSELFYEKLAGILTSVEAGNIPEVQRGFYDINDGFFDWSESVEKLPFYRRYKAKKKIKASS
ncbi:MAG: hypothetical protein WD266_10450 [Balneolales bacterium]